MSKQRIYEIDCEECGRSYVSHRIDKKFCSASCRGKYHYSKKLEKEFGDTNTVVSKDVLFPKINHSIDTDVEWTVEFIELNTNLSRKESKEVVRKTFDFNPSQPPIDGIRGVKIGEVVRFDGKEALIKFCNKVLSED